MRGAGALAITGALGFLQGCGASGAEGGGCTLSSLFLRAMADAHGNARVIDIVPMKNSSRKFSAKMDYSMVGFDMEAFAEPAEGCRARRLTETTIMVDPGSQVLAEVVVEGVDGSGGHIAGSEVYYSVLVSRMSGTETTLDDLEVEGGAMFPDWSSEVRVYKVMMDRSLDMVRFKFQRTDAGEVVTLHAEREWETGGPASRTRRLWVGDTQHSPSTLATTIDVGCTRVVNLHIDSADQGSEGAYSFTVQRPPCPKELPFFDGEARVCTDICNAGFFGSVETGRCAACGQANCAVCASVKRCSTCAEGFEADGRACRRIGTAPGYEGPIEEVEDLVGRVPPTRGVAALCVVVLAVGVAATVRCCGRRPSRRRAADALEGSDSEVLPHIALRGGSSVVSRGDYG